MHFNIRSSKRRRRKDSLDDDGVAVLPAQRLVQNKLIMRALDESFGKFKISIKLPVIFRNPLTVLRSVSGTNYEPCAHALLEFLRRVDKSKPFDVDGPHVNDTKLIAVIEMFQKNYEILDHLPNWTKEECLADHTVLEAFGLLEEIVEHRIRRSAQVVLRREREVHTLYIKNRILRKEIDGLRRSVRVLKRQTRWKRIVPTPDVVQAQHEVRRKEVQRVRCTNRAMADEAQKIKSLSYDFESKYNRLESEITEAKIQFLKLKKKHEKELIKTRDEKDKTAIQLQSMIEKHDRVLTEKFKEQLSLDEELQKKKNEMEIFMTEYRAAKDELENLLREQEEFRQAKIDRFIRNRAARIIQRCWTRYANNIKERSQQQGKGRYARKRDTNSLKRENGSSKK